MAPHSVKLPGPEERTYSLTIISRKRLAVRRLTSIRSYPALALVMCLVVQIGGVTFRSISPLCGNAATPQRFSRSRQGTALLQPSRVRHSHSANQSDDPSIGWMLKPGRIWPVLSVSSLDVDNRASFWLGCVMGPRSGRSPPTLSL
jgi:hypothetical protein